LRPSLPTAWATPSSSKTGHGCGENPHLYSKLTYDRLKISVPVAAETAKIFAMPDVQKRLTDIGLTPVGNTPAQFATTVKSDFDRWGAAIRKANIKLD